MNNECFEQIKKGPEAFNQWRSANPEAHIDLNGANFAEWSLPGINLSGAFLIKTSFVKADLSKANLSGATMTEADLRMASLYEANLAGTDFTGADLSGANLNKADITNSKFSNTQVRYSLIDGKEMGSVVW